MNSLYLLDVTKSIFVNFLLQSSTPKISLKSSYTFVVLIWFVFIRVKIFKNIEGRINRFPECKSKSGLHLVVLKSPKLSSEKRTLVVVEKHQRTDIGKFYLKNEIFRPKRLLYNGSREVRKKFEPVTRVEHCLVQLSK